MRAAVPNTLADEEHAVVRVERDDRDRARVAGDLTATQRAVGPRHRVDAELQIPPAVEDLR